MLPSEMEEWPGVGKKTVVQEWTTDGPLKADITSVMTIVVQNTDGIVRQITGNVMEPSVC